MTTRTVYQRIIIVLTAAIVAFTLSVPSAKADNYQLSTHILDINKGRPASGVEVELFKMSDSSEWTRIDGETTDSNGRIANFLKEGKEDNKGVYKLVFYVAPYIEKEGQESIYPFIEIVFKIDEDVHYHIPLTLSANGYSTYRGN